MTTVRDLRTNAVYTGRAPESIVRRVWGRKAEIKWESTVAGRAAVVKPLGDSRFNVLATIFVYDD